jgi:hypothetical protein
MSVITHIATEGNECLLQNQTHHIRDLPRTVQALESQDEWHTSKCNKFLAVILPLI